MNYSHSHFFSAVHPHGSQVQFSQLQCSLLHIFSPNVRFFISVIYSEQKSPPVQNTDGRIECQLVNRLDFLISNRN